MNKALDEFKKEFSENIDKVLNDKNSAVDKETLEVMKDMIKNMKLYLRDK